MESGGRRGGRGGAGEAERASVLLPAMESDDRQFKNIVASRRGRDPNVC